MKSVLEKWKAVPGYEGYEVSDQGNVRALNYHREGKVKILRNMKQQTGYERVCLFRNNTRNYLYIHRLVWETFNGKIPDGLQIDHINTVRDDNRLVNLRVVTHKENCKNSITAERNREANRRKSKDPKWIEAHREGVKRLSQDPKWREAVREAVRKSCAKHVLQLDKQTGEVIREWECQRDIERELGINQRKISLCCLGKRKSTGGYRWRFA